LALAVVAKFTYYLIVTPDTPTYIQLGFAFFFGTSKQPILEIILFGMIVVHIYLLRIMGLIHTSELDQENVSQAFARVIYIHLLITLTPR
jgi:hypothetical protein